MLSQKQLEVLCEALGAEFHGFTWYVRELSVVNERSVYIRIHLLDGARFVGACIVDYDGRQEEFRHVCVLDMDVERVAREFRRRT